MSYRGKVILLGNAGVGKTATIKLFGEMLKTAQKKEGIAGRCAYIDCRKNLRVIKF